MSDYDVRQVLLLVLGAAVAWEGFYMAFKSVVLGGASYHPIFSGLVGLTVGALMFVIGGLIAYGTYLEVSEGSDAPEGHEETFARRTASTTRGDEAARQRERGVSSDRGTGDRQRGTGERPRRPDEPADEPDEPRSRPVEPRDETQERRGPPHDADGEPPASGDRVTDVTETDDGDTDGDSFADEFDLEGEPDRR